LHAGFDAVTRAAALLQGGQDDAALEALQTIGLTSPFLQWRVFLRGLSAYYRNDDVRARDNWQRLDPERLPWRLAAPFRSRIDPAFRQLQPPQTQQRLRSALDRAAGPGLAASLRSLEPALA